MSRTSGDLSTRPFIVLGSYVVGIAGLIVAILGYSLACSTSSEQKAVQLTVRPTVNQRDFTDEGLGLRVAIVNESLRSVIISRASLWMGACKVGDALGWVRDVRVFDRHGIDPGALVDAKLDLPITINSREGLVIAVLVDAWTPCFGEGSINSEESIRAARRNKQKLEGTLASYVPIQPGMTPRFDWQNMAIARGKKVVGLILRRKLGATGQADVVTLDVWRRFASFHRHVERPILGADFTFFPLKDLPDGRFLYAFRLAGKTIASSRFVNPAPCKTYYGWQQPPCRR